MSEVSTIPVMPNLLNHFHEMVPYNLVHLFETLFPLLLHGRQTLMEKQMTRTERKVCISLNSPPVIHFQLY